MQIEESHEDRDIYVRKLTCSNCGTKGVAKCSVDESRFSANFRVLIISPSFTYSHPSDEPHKAGFTCNFCGASVS